MAQTPKQIRQTRQRELAGELWSLIEPTGFVTTELGIANYQAIGPAWLLSEPLFMERYPHIADKIAAYNQIEQITNPDSLLHTYNTPKRPVFGKPKPASMRKLEERQATEAAHRAAKEAELKRRLAALRNRKNENSNR
jgi:hypothetical protein